MRYGITGNTQKEKLWQPVAELIAFLRAEGLRFCMKAEVAAGLQARGLVERRVCLAHTVEDLSAEADVILSFGGDGTLLRSAHEVGARGTPILGVNIGRLGFLADTEVRGLEATIERLEQGDYRLEPRLVLSADLPDGFRLDKPWALNEFIIERSGNTGLISVEVFVDGMPLNDYWADGLIVATPTGSTAYNLSLGGPIILPGAEVIVLTPIAPHSLTVRPIVLPDASVIEARVTAGGAPYVLSGDGRGSILEQDGLPITIRRAAHRVQLVKLPEQHYFDTLRSKLMWGIRSS